MIAMAKGKIELKKISMRNVPRITELFANEKVLKNLLTPLHANEVTLKKEQAWARGTIKEYRKKKPSKYELSIIIDGEIAGGVGVPKIDWANNKAEIGYWLGEEYWGKGYMTRAVRQFIKHADKKFGFKRYEIKAYAHNRASRRVAEKNGFGLEGIHRKAVKKWGKYVDETCYALIK